MILTSLQQFVANLHKGDAYFTAAPGCVVIWDGQKELETNKLLSTADAIEDALDTVGAVAVVSEAEVTAGEDNVFVDADLSVLYIENVAQNRGPNGTGKTANQFGQKGWALCVGQFSAPWAPLIFKGLNPAKVNRDGFTAWELQLSTNTLYDTLVECLANDANRLLATESGAPLLISPTDP